MALDFPTTPANGFVYTSPTGEQWTYETATNSWTSKGLVNNSGGIKYVGTIDITAAPPTGVTGGALYTVAADGTANAGFGPGVTGALTKGDSVMNTGAGWIKLSHPTSVWLKTGTNLAPTATGDVVSISAGTAALPGLTPVGDLNTGVWSPGADQLAISTGGVQRATVDASGRLLVGTTGTAYDHQFVKANSAGDFTFAIRNSAAATNTSASLILQTATADTTNANKSVISGVKDSTANGSELRFLTEPGPGGSAPVEACRITSEQKLLVGTTTTTANGGVLQVSNGITFPATAVACTDVNTLDDYEEGTFTATLRGSTTDPTTPVTSTARYTKIGNVVYVQITFDGVTTTGAVGGITITGLPITPATGHRYIGSAFSSNIATFTGTMVSTIDNNLTTIYFYAIASNAANGTVTHNAGTSRVLHVTCFYYV